MNRKPAVIERRAFLPGDFFSNSCLNGEIYLAKVFGFRVDIGA